MSATLEFTDERADKPEPHVFNRRAALAVFRAVLHTAGVGVRCAASVTLVEPERIRALNRERRGVDAVTDVLSFPMLEGMPARADLDPDTGAAFLGDVVINARRVREQAQEYGHGVEREFSYLLAHGFLHLLGYDHACEEDKRFMRVLEEEALAACSGTGVSDEELVERAKKAMRNAYAPYSGYSVGACLMTAGGELYTGANVENASYGLTICAERAAMVRAVSAGRRAFEAIAVAAAGAPPFPCGACRQVLYEFAPSLRVIVAGGDGVLHTMALDKLLPDAFGGENLLKQ